MFKDTIFEVSITVLLLWITPSIQNIQDESSISNADLETISDVCSLTLKLRSTSQSFLVANLNRHFPITPTLLHFHKELIPTTIINHQNNLENCVTPNRENNILFIVNDCHEILSLILEFARRKKSENKEDSFQYFQNNFQRPSPDATLPRYCVRSDTISSSPRSDNKLFNEQIDCDFNVAITDRELKSRSIISHELWNLTRHLYADRIFNGQNNLIFFIPENTRKVPDFDSNIFESIENRNASPQCDLMLLFRFSWRIFRGFRTVICPGKRICYRYDPFNETIIRYKENADSIFAWPERRGIKNLVLKNYCYEPFNSPLDFISLNLLIDVTEGLRQLQRLLNFDLELFEEGKTKSRKDYSYGLKVDADLVIFGEGVKGAPSSDLLDFSFLIETCSICYIAPRRGFTPQYLVPFSSFTIEVWMMTALTFVFCLLIHYTFNLLVPLWFRPFLTEEHESMEIKKHSSLWSVFCYFICTAQPRLLLGRFYGGKIFFIALVFSTQTLTAIFQGQMVTLMSTGVRLSDIISIEALEKSQIQIHLPEFFEDSEIIRDHFGLQMKDKLTDSLEHLRKLLPMRVFSSDSESDEEISSEDVTRILNAIAVRMREDAFFIRFPQRINEKIKKQLLSMSIVSDGSYSMECIVDYPIYLSLSKYSLYSKVITDFLLRLSENGAFDRISKLQLSATHQLAFFQPDFEECLNLRAFSLADLSPGFICLVCGLSLSSFIFSFEILFQGWL